MGKREDIIMRLRGEKEVYDDSPQVTVTYKDLSRFVDHLIELTENKDVMGFKGGQDAGGS